MKKKTIQNPIAFRNNVRLELSSILDRTPISTPPFSSTPSTSSTSSTSSTPSPPPLTIPTNCEISLYNYAILKAQSKNIIKKWDNPAFVELYIEKLRTLFWNLKNNPILCQRLVDGDIESRNIAFTSHQEFHPSEWSPYIEEKNRKEKAKSKSMIEASTDKFTCSRCKSKKCTYYELQTRSADEPVTVFITCLVCDKRWKM